MNNILNQNQMKQPDLIIPTTLKKFIEKRNKGIEQPTPQPREQREFEAYQKGIKTKLDDINVRGEKLKVTDQEAKRAYGNYWKSMKLNKSK
jgi:hypothetical protein